MLGTERIDPCMKFHTTVVALLNHPLQRIPVRRRSLSLHTRQITAPWLILTGIERITLSTHLEDDGIHTILLQFIQLSGEHSLNLLRTLT